MRAQLKHLLLDVDFKDKPKVIDLEETLGAIARLLFIDCLCLMSKSTDGGISHKSILFLAKRIKIKIEDAEKFIKYVIEQEMFFEVKGLYFNKRVNKDQESLALKRKNALERQERFRDRGVSNALQTRLPDPVSVTDTEYKYNNISVPDSVDSPELRAAIRNWSRKLQSSNPKRDYDQITFDSHLMKFGSAQAYIEAVNYSCAMSKTLNLYAPPPTQATKKTRAQEILEMGAKL